MSEPGTIVVLNGAPRAGKTSIATAIQNTWPGVWMNLGVDAYILEVTPAKFRPGIGLRPGGERPDLEPLLPVFYAALYESNHIDEITHEPRLLFREPWGSVARHYHCHQRSGLRVR